MSKRTFIIICVVAGVIIVGFWIYLIILLNSKPKQLDTNKVSSFVIPTSQGKVTTNNFEKNAVGIYSGTVVLESNADYGITFNPKANSFDIVLNSTPLQNARSMAEAGLLKDLGINNSDACKLTVTMSVPARIDYNASGTNYGLSFCPNSNPLPNE